MNGARAGWLDYWPVVLVIGLGLALVLGLVQVSAKQAAEAQLSQTQNALNALSTRSEVSALATFGPVLTLAAVVQVDGDISPARFDTLMGQMASTEVHLRSIVAAPAEVVRMVYPLTGNEMISGRDYRDIPEQYPSVQEARQRGVPVLVAPTRLVEGFQSVILRVPVFISSGGELSPHYWGVVSGAVELEQFVHLAGLDRPNLTVNAALFEARCDGMPGRLIWGDERVAAQRPMLQVVNLPGGRWVLAAVPKAGWQIGASWNSPEILIALLTVTLLTAGTAVLTRQRLLLRGRHAAFLEEIDRGRATLSDLRRSEARLTSVAALGSDTVWEQDAQFRFTYISALSDQRRSAVYKGLIGQCRWDAAGPSPANWAAHRACLERHESFHDFEYSLFSPNGLIWLSISGAPLFNDRGLFIGYRGTGRDITERRQHEADLHAAQAAQAQSLTRMEALLDAAVEVAIIATDLQGRITVFNEGARRMVQFSEKQMLGQCPTQLHLHSELEERADELETELGERLSGFEVLVAQAKRHALETRVWSYIRQDGFQIAVSLTMSRVTSRSGELLGYLGIARELTAQRQAESQLRELNALLETRVSLRTAELSAARNHLQRAHDELVRSEKMAALGSLVAGVAHELNSPLGNCVTTASTLESRTREALKALEDGTLRRSSLEAFLEDVGTSADILMRSLNHAEELVQHFKQVSADQVSARRREFELGTTVNEALTVLRPRLRGTPYKVECDIRVSRPLDSYPGPLSQIVSNLVQNALLHAFAGRELGRLLIRARDLDAEHVELIVQDDGVGMSEEVRKRAFEPFFTTKLNRGGTGLGLNIVHELAVGPLGGEVEIESAPGQGCRFIFSLPFVAPSSAGFTPIHGVASVFADL
ncbi:MAG TPA: ATP-binding protein [Burkholderiaceae bacterium]